MGEVHHGVFLGVPYPFPYSSPIPYPIPIPYPYPYPYPYPSPIPYPSLDSPLDRLQAVASGNAASTRPLPLTRWIHHSRNLRAHQIRRSRALGFAFAKSP